MLEGLLFSPGPSGVEDEICGLFRFSWVLDSRVQQTWGRGISSLSSQSSCSFKYRCLKLRFYSLLTGSWSRVHSSFRRWWQWVCLLQESSAELQLHPLESKLQFWPRRLLWARAAVALTGKS